MSSSNVLLPRLSGFQSASSSSQRTLLTFTASNAQLRFHKNSLAPLLHFVVGNYGRDGMESSSEMKQHLEGKFWLHVWQMRSSGSYDYQRRTLQQQIIGLVFSEVLCYK
jgi:hypothetical protein